MNKNDTAKILVIRGGAIGDFILTLPVLAALRRFFPDGRIEVLGHPRITALALAANLADATRPVESPDLAAFFVPGGNLNADAAAWFAGFDTIISYLHDPSLVFQSNVARCSSARYIQGPHRPGESEDLHATATLLKPLEALGVSNADSRPRLNIASTPLDAAWLAIHPGSGSPAKNWPEENWAGLLNILIDKTGAKILLVGGEAEGDRLPRLAARFPSERMRLEQDLPLVELARQLKTCGGFIGHDSGVTHLAAALDMPGVVLWANTSETVWRPQSPNMKLLRHPDGISVLSVLTVFEEMGRICQFTCQ